MGWGARDGVPLAQRPIATSATQTGGPPTGATAIRANPAPAASRRTRPSTRHVLVHLPPPAAPVEGLVLDWAREDDRWIALVVYVEEAEHGNVITQRWMVPAALTPLYDRQPPPPTGGP